MRLHRSGSRRGCGMKSLVLWGALWAISGWGAAAHAQASDQREQQASAHFEKGVEFYRDGSLDAALVEFERAYELVPNFRLLYNLAQIQAEKHDYAAALGLFEKYLQDGGAELPEARRAETQREIARLRGLVAYLTVESDVEGAKLLINGAPAGVLPLAEPVPINPGTSEVRLEKDGYAAAVERIKVAGGERPSLKLSLNAASEDGGAQGQAVGVTYTPLWISSGVTLGLGAAALGFGLAARGADDDLGQALDEFPADQAEIDDARSRLRVYSAMTDTFAAASVVALGFAVYFLIAPPKRARKESASVHIAPNGRGLTLRATF